MDLSFQPLWVNADGGDCWAVRWVLRFRPLSPLQDSGKPTPAHTPLGQNHLRTAPMTFIVPGLHPPQSFRIKNKKKEKERKRKNKFRTAFLKSAFCRCEPAPAPAGVGASPLPGDVQEAGSAFGPQLLVLGAQGVPVWKWLLLSGGRQAVPRGGRGAERPSGSPPAPRHWRARLASPVKSFLHATCAKQ